MTAPALDRALPRTSVARVGVHNRILAAPLLRWLVVLVAAFFVLYSAYDNITEQRNDAANAHSFSLASGTRIGQTFLARYPDLSAVEVRASAYKLSGPRPGATLVMHLRETPSKGPDLRTASMHLSNDFQESDYLRFSFAPIHDSVDRHYYVEFESPDSTPGNELALMWWQQIDPTLKLLTDPYADGNTYINLQPQQLDISFGLAYSPNPVAAFWQFGRYVALQVPRWLLLLAGGLVALLAATALYFTLSRSRTRRLKPLLLKWSLPIVLGVALVNGLVYALVTPPWQGPDEHGHFTYAALLDRHNFDETFIDSMQWWTGGKDYNEIITIKNAIVASMDRFNWTRLVSGHPTPGASAFPPADDYLYNEFIWETHQPPLYYWLCAGALRVARFVGMSADPVANPEGALRLMRMVSVALNLCVVALAWLAGRLLGGRGLSRFPWLRLLLPLTIALLPMHTFIASIVSNDIIAELSVVALFVSLVALLRWPTGGRGAGLLLLSVLLLVCTLGTKLTATVAGAPLFALGFVVWVGIVATRFFERRGWLRAGRSRDALKVPALVGLCLVTLSVVGAVLLFRQGEQVAVWRGSGGASTRPLRVQSSTAHDGSYVMQVASGQGANQWVQLPWPHSAYTLTVSLWARPAPGAAPVTTPTLGTLDVSLDTRGSLARIGAETLPSTGATFTMTKALDGGWSQVTATLPGTVLDRKVWLRMHAGDMPVQFDSFSMSMLPVGGTTVQAVPVPPSNPSAEQGSLSFTPLGQRLLAGDNGDILDILVNPQQFSKRDVFERYAGRQFRSFWGNFGWLSIPLPDVQYGAIMYLIAIAVIGLLVIAVRRFGRWSSAEWLGPVTVAAFTVAVVITFARQMASLPVQGVHADPQGRYVFGFTVPLIWLGLVGLRAVWSVISRVVPRYAGRWLPGLRGVAGPQQGVVLPWGAWLWSVGVAFFAAYCLLALVMPYFYS